MTRKQVKLLRALGVDFANYDYKDIADLIDIHRRAAQTKPEVRLQINKTVDREFKNNLKSGMSVDQAYNDLYNRIANKQNVSNPAQDVAFYKLAHTAHRYKNKK